MDRQPQCCRECGAPCPRMRWCYAIPMCFACLPPPPPIPVLSWPTAPVEGNAADARPDAAEGHDP
jgi:hypothetical protein